MDLEEEKPTLPEPEAIALSKLLRKQPIEGVALSVFAFINGKGVRGLQVCCDLPDGSRYDMNYKADRPSADLAAHARRRILARIANT